MENNSTKNDYTFPVSKPICCGLEMFPCGGSIGVRPDGMRGDLSHLWACSVCGSETEDLLSQKDYVASFLGTR